MLSKKQKAYLNLARDLATRSKQKHRHGAVVVKSGRVLGVGYNKRRNSPLIVNPGRHRHDSGYHAEFDALRYVKNPSGCVVYVARVNNNGEDRLSKPCSICHELMDELGVKAVIYTR